MLGNRVIGDAFSEDEVIVGQVAPNLCYGSLLMKSRSVDTDVPTRRVLPEDEDRSMPAKNPRTASKAPEAGAEAGSRLALTASEGITLPTP